MVGGWNSRKNSSAGLWVFPASAKSITGSDAMSNDRTAWGQQQTLARPAIVSGRGLFHGREARMRLLPADPDTGIVFRRVDLPGRPEVLAHVSNVTSAPRRTVLASATGAQVETVEHIMSAVAGLQLDNCIIEINNIEVPAVDGSCLPFCEAILEAGMNELPSPRLGIIIDESHSVNDRAGEQWIEVIPAFDGISTVDYRLDYGAESPIKSQSFSVTLSPEAFLNEIAPARTFVLSAEVEQLQLMGYGRHLTGKDLIVFDTEGNVIDNKLRWADEPVRHKILDCIGDLALGGRNFVGRVVARRSGHKLNHVMATTLSMIETDSPRLQWAA